MTRRVVEWPSREEWGVVRLERHDTDACGSWQADCAQCTRRADARDSRRLARVAGLVLERDEPDYSSIDLWQAASVLSARHRLPATARLHKAIEQARREAHDECERQAAETPVDDAAWERELERRGRVERYLNGART